MGTTYHCSECGVQVEAGGFCSAHPDAQVESATDRKDTAWHIGRYCADLAWTTGASNVWCETATDTGEIAPVGGDWDALTEAVGAWTAGDEICLAFEGGYAERALELIERHQEELIG